MEQRSFAEAVASHERALQLLRAKGDRYGEGCALHNLSVALQGSKRYAETAAACEQAVTIFRDAKDRAREGLALDSQGRALAGLQRFAIAITAHEAAAACFRAVSDRRRAADYGRWARAVRLAAIRSAAIARARSAS